MFVIALTSGSVLAKGSKPGGGNTTCTAASPGISIQNTWAWASPGSFGLAGQQLTYLLQVVNYDTGCGSSTFVVSVTAADGFIVSVPSTTITLGSGATALLSTFVTSPAGGPDGDYPVIGTIARSGNPASAGSYTSYYKVYSTDTTAPTPYWPSPGNGQIITGRSFWIQVSATDDHSVRKIDLYLDGAFKTTSTCDGISYSCGLTYKWSTVKGPHTATFVATDWMNNAGSLSVSFTVS